MAYTYLSEYNSFHVINLRLQFSTNWKIISIILNSQIHKYFISTAKKVLDVNLHSYPAVCSFNSLCALSIKLSMYKCVCIYVFHICYMLICCNCLFLQFNNSVNCMICTAKCYHVGKSLNDWSTKYLFT